MGEAAHGQEAAKDEGTTGVRGGREIGPYDGNGFALENRERVESLWVEDDGR